MNPKEWAEKFAAGIQEWIASVEDMFDVELEDEEEQK